MHRESCDKKENGGMKKGGGGIRREDQIKNLGILALKNVQEENSQNSQVSSDEEVVDDGPEKHMKKPKIRRWKLQARNHSGKKAGKSVPITKKKPMEETRMTSPITKK